MKRTFLVAVLIACTGVFLLAAGANAATITIPNTTVQSTAAGPGVPGGGTSGPTIALTSDVAPTDTLTLTARGEIFLQNGNTYGTNAAGVVTTAGTTSKGGTSLNPVDSTNYGSLLLGNAIVGFHQLFPADAANGLGSLNPPSILSFTGATLASLGFGSVMTAGTVLEFRISDTLVNDNSGSFTVNGEFDTAAAAVPEPATLGLITLGGALWASLRRRSRRQGGIYTE